jgi:hypothetical protein
VLTTSTYAQQARKTTVLKSAITTAGLSSRSIANNKYYVKQSIGEDGIIGTADLNSSTVQQGFLSHIISSKRNNPVHELLDLIIYPNPFVEYLKIDFSKRIEDAVYIKIYDVLGKIYRSKKYLPSDNITIPLHELSSGKYLIDIQTGENHMTKKIVKTQEE